jgi:hypothetical protein
MNLYGSKVLVSLYWIHTYIRPHNHHIKNTQFSGLHNPLPDSKFKVPLITTSSFASQLHPYSISKMESKQ